MTTYFTQSNIMKRFFFLVGKTKDTFVDEALQAYDLEYMLYDHLKKLGYERIVFYGKTQKLYCYDENSYKLILNSNQSMGTQSVPKRPMITKGPLGGRLLGANTTQQSITLQAAVDVLHFGKMNDMDAFQRIDFCMQDKRHKTAIIFNNAEDVIGFFGEVRTDRGSESIRSKIYDSINSYDGLDYDNENIMLFVFPQRSLSETKVLCDYNAYQTTKKATEKCLDFVMNKWNDYLSEFEVNGMDEEIQRGLIQIILYKIVRNRIVIQHIKEGVQL